MTKEQIDVKLYDWFYYWPSADGPIEGNLAGYPVMEALESHRAFCKLLSSLIGEGDSCV